MRALLASPLGFLIGVSLGALGGGGSILAVPALVYAAGQSPKQATTTSLVLVTITALTGIVPHWRAGRVRLVAGMVFGAAGVGGSLLGSSWNKSADPNVLLLAFSGVMLVAASAMWRRSARSAEPAAGQRPTVVSASTVIKVVVAGTGVGLLTGFFGVGGGFAVVPTLVIALGFAMREAVATSLLILTLNTGSALVARAVGEGIHVDWGMIAPFTVATVVGSFVGARLGPRLPERSLQRAFALLLVLVAVYTAWKSLT